jgi:hypothetical protein
MSTVRRRGAWRDLRASLEGLADRQADREAQRIERRRNGRRPGSTKWAEANKARMPWPKNELRPEDALRSRASFLP